MIQSFTISYVVDNATHDFTLPPLSAAVMLPLINVLKMEYQKRIAADCAPSFAMERALQHQRHLEYCLKNNKQPQQQFIDFPLPENF